MRRSNLRFHVVANAALGPGLSGGDRIFIELARRWAASGHTVNVYVWEEGYEMCRRNNLTGVNYVFWPAARWKKFGFPILFLARTIIGCCQARHLELRTPNSELRTGNFVDIVYSASDHWPDFVPSLLLSRRLENSKFIGTFYLAAPNPFGRGSPYRAGGLLRGLAYYLMQKPVVRALKSRADMIFVTSEPDRNRFISERLTREKVVVVRGGVDIKKIENQKSKMKNVEKIYDAVFQGRFHPQKGVVEFIDIWKKVVESKPDAKLAMIGDGPLFKKVQMKIANEGLTDSVRLFGFLPDGAEKYRVFAQSKVVVHPAIYDSGGMAACEAMAAKLPGVSFDLEALRTYYPQGMLKTPCFDLRKFAENILRLLRERDLYARMSREAFEWAREWDWDTRAEGITKVIETGLAQSRGA